MAREPKFTKLDGRTFNKTVVRQLCPVADLCRDLITQLGMRAYKVSVIQTRWTGMERGSGQEVLIDKPMLILPTPRVVGIQALDLSVQAPGTTEIGSVTVDRISSRYTEEQLRGISRDGYSPTQEINVYWEIEFFEQTGYAIPRRFVLAKAPEYHFFGWTVHLDRAEGDRTRREHELLS